MNVLRVIHSMDPVNGGPCQGLRNLIPELEKLGCLNEVVCLDDPSAPFLGSDPFAVHALGKGVGPLRYHPALVPWLRANMERFDALVVHGIWLWTSLAVWLVCRGPFRTTGAKPYFVMPHGMLDPWFQKAAVRGGKALRNRLYWDFAEQRVIRDAEAVLFTCERELELAASTFRHYAPKRQVNVGYGVPVPPAPIEAMTAAFSARCPAMPADTPFLLFLGRIDPKKGVDLLIASYAEVYGRQTGRLPALVIAGPLESEYAGSMIAYASSLLPGAVHAADFPGTSLSAGGPGIYFPGMLLGDGKWGALHGCDALVLPSHQENFGIAVAEALGCGKPVLVSTQVNIIREIISGGAGFADEDTREGCTRLLELWKDSDMKERKTMGMHAMACFSDHFGVGTAAAKFRAVISNPEFNDHLP